MVAEDMLMATKVLQKNEKEICALLNTSKAEKLIDNMHFSRKSPEQWRVLMGK